MKQAMYQETKRSPLARQTKSEAIHFRTKRAFGFDRQLGVSPTVNWGGLPLRNIPHRSDYLSTGFASEASGRQDGFSRDAERTMTIDSPQPESEETELTAAKGLAGDIKWNKYMRATGEDRLHKIIGIFKDEPLMASLMESIHEDRRLEAEAEMSR